MNPYLLSHLSDSTLARDLPGRNANELGSTAMLLAYIAEFDFRKLYVPAGYPSMFAYCLHVLHRTEEATYKRIHAARAARRLPAIFPMIADGRLHLSGVVLLAPHLTAENAEELLAGAANRTKDEIERLIAGRFPRPEQPDRVRLLRPRILPAEAERAELGTTGTPVPCDLGDPQLPAANRAEDFLEHAPGRVDEKYSTPAHASTSTLLGIDSLQHSEHATSHVDLPTARPRLMPVSSDRFELRVTIEKTTHDKMRHAQNLLGRWGNGDLSIVLDRAFEALVRVLEKRRFAMTDRPRDSSARPSDNPRYIPAAVRRAVRRRDGHQCTFVNDSGERCPARAGLELDHIEPIARGGESTEKNLRLRCRAHNQFEAERLFGAAFMEQKRAQSRDTAA